MDINVTKLRKRIAEYKLPNEQEVIYSPEDIKRIFNRVIDQQVEEEQDQFAKDHE